MHTMLITSKEFSCGGMCSYAISRNNNIYLSYPVNKNNSNIYSTSIHVVEKRKQMNIIKKMSVDPNYNNILYSTYVTEEPIGPFCVILDDPINEKMSENIIDFKKLKEESFILLKKRFVDFFGEKQIVKYLYKNKEYNVVDFCGYKVGILCNYESNSFNNQSDEYSDDNAYVKNGIGVFGGENGFDIKFE